MGYFLFFQIWGCFYLINGVMLLVLEITSTRLPLKKSQTPREEEKKKQRKEGKKRKKAKSKERAE